MTRKKINMDPERNLIINLITSTEFCRNIIPLINNKYLETSYAREVFKWVKEYYNEYQVAPGSNIKTIYKKKRSSINENDVDEVSEFMTSISKQYEQAPETNINFEIQNAKENLILLDLKYITGSLADAVEEKDINKALAIWNSERLTINSRPLYSRIGEIEIKPPEWIIEGLFEKDSTSIIFGDPGTGKSFLALALGACIASGTDFFTHQTKIVGPVIYICGEGRNTIARRCKAWAVNNNEINLNDYPFFTLDVAIRLLDEKSLLSLSASLKDIADKEGAPALIIIDTWNRLSGGDENSNSDAAKAIAALDRLREPYGCSALIVHHSGHSDKGRARGASALNGAVDNAYKIERKDSDSPIVMTATKTKDGKAPEEMAFNLIDIDLGLNDEHGVMIQSAALELDGDYIRPINQARPLLLKAQLALDTLKDVILESSDKATYKLWSNACINLGIGVSTFNNYRKNLIERNIIYLDDIYYRIKPALTTTTTTSKEGCSKVGVEEGNYNLELSCSKVVVVAEDRSKLLRKKMNSKKDKI